MEAHLSSAQSAALFDILSHHNTYTEIRDFRHPGSLKDYGPPFAVEKEKPSTSPSLQSLLSKFVLNLPGLRDVPEDIWKVNVYEIIEAFEQANLSDSYDKGVVGTRKTLATAISALIEYPVRGTAGGFTKVADPKDEYDLTKADDLAKGFRNFMDEAIYGTAIENLVAKTAETDKLADHEPLTQAVHEFILVNVASFMHYTIILSPKGQYLLKLLGNANKLVPYIVIKQTLKIGNVASMISAMMRVVLAKLSVASVTNWIGLTSSEDTGLNLMQQIISTVIHWDLGDLGKRASKLESDKESPSKAQLACLKRYTNLSLDEQDVIRAQSQQSSISIVISILASSELPTDLSEKSHKLALEYLSLIFSIRDRNEIIRILCRSNPDHVTTTVRTMVNAYEPVIRNIHNAVDLSDTVSDFQAFLSDMIKMSKIPPPGKDGETITPTVGDFVQLLKKHQYSVHKFLHQCAKNGKELTSWYSEWLKETAAKFRRDTTTSDATIRDAGHLTAPLNELFSALPASQQEQILPILNAQSKYLDELHASSKKRLEAVLKSSPSKSLTVAKVLASSRPSSRGSSPDRSGRVTPAMQSPVARVPGPAMNAGPGAYLARWQDLLDNTPLTPKTAVGEEVFYDARDGGVGGGGKPDVSVVIEAMGQDFRKLLGRRGVYW